MQNKSEAYRQRFLIADRDGYITVPVSEVSYISAESRIARLFMKDKQQYTVDMSLDDIDAQLDPVQFFRATRQ
ncbi:MAG: LytTR family transcriptional regulator, partial [Muribaculum sp.]|nr:LytTR family transcriptional regulator [Muribaculum sp.]